MNSCFDKTNAINIRKYPELSIYRANPDSLFKGPDRVSALWNKFLSYESCEAIIHYSFHDGSIIEFLRLINFMTKLRVLGQQVSRDDVRALLDKVPDVEPDANDQLPAGFRRG